MNIADLSKIDIKDIDVAKIKEQLLQRKEVVFQVVLGLVAFFIAISMINQSQGDIKNYKAKIANLQAKTGAIEQYNKTQSDVRDYLSKVPEYVSDDKIINLVTDYAGQYDIKIITFTPANIEKKHNLETMSLKFTLVAESFAAMVKFMAAVERGKDFMQIWSCEIEPDKGPKGSGKNDDGVLINFRIEVASIKVEK